MPVIYLYFFRLSHKESKAEKLEDDWVHKVGENSEGKRLNKTCTLAPVI